MVTTEDCKLLGEANSFCFPISWALLMVILLLFMFKTIMLFGTVILHTSYAGGFLLFTLHMVINVFTSKELESALLECQRS
jgi:hypothetical protein